MASARKGAVLRVDAESQRRIKRTMGELRRLEPDTAKACRREFRALAKKVALDARGRAPRRTGALARSVRPRVSSSGVAAVAASNPAARPNEFGGRHPLFGNTSHWYPMQKRPLLFPAVDAHSREFFSMAEAIVTKSAKSAGFK